MSVTAEDILNVVGARSFAYTGSLLATVMLKIRSATTYDIAVKSSKRQVSCVKVMTIKIQQKCLLIGVWVIFWLQLERKVLNRN